MTRDDLVSYITTKAQMLESDDVAACQTFVSKRYELIYNSYLWKDALTMVDLAIDPVNNPDNAVGIVSLPSQIERVVAIRTATQAVKIHALEEYYRIDWNRFADISDINGLMEFAILNPIWLTCRPGPLPPSIIPANATYNAFTYGLFAALTPGKQYVILMAQAPTALQGYVQCGMNNGGVGLINPVTLPIASGVPFVFTANGDSLLILNAGTPFNGPVNAALYLTALPKNQGTSASTVIVTSDNAADLSNGATPIKVKITWRDSTNRFTQTVNLPSTLTPSDGSGFIEIESIFKPSSLGNITATLNTPVSITVGNVTSTYTFTNLLGTLLPSDTRSPGLQRVRLLSAPNQALTLSVLGKKPFVPLDFGSEVPLIRNLDNCLIAFGLADMLQRGRQYGKAAQQMQEATTLLSELAKLETLQAANNQRFVPDAGYGDPFFAPSSNRGIWT